MKKIRKLVKFISCLFNRHRLQPYSEFMLRSWYKITLKFNVNICFQLRGNIPIVVMINVRSKREHNYSWCPCACFICMWSYSTVQFIACVQYRTRCYFSTWYQFDKKETRTMLFLS